MGLGLGGEIGARDFFNQATGTRFALGIGFHLADGGAAKIDDIGFADLQAKLFQQFAVVQQVLAVAFQP